MRNPDPKKFKLKKLRGRDFILVSTQVLRWRKRKKKAMASPEKPRQRAVNRARLNREAEARARAYKLFE